MLLGDTHLSLAASHAPGHSCPPSPSSVSDALLPFDGNGRTRGFTTMTNTITSRSSIVFCYLFVFYSGSARQPGVTTIPSVLLCATNQCPQHFFSCELVSVYIGTKTSTESG